MQLPCVIMRDDMFFAGIFTFLVCLRFKFKFFTTFTTFRIKKLEFKPKTNQKSKKHNKKHIFPFINTRW